MPEQSPLTSHGKDLKIGLSERNVIPHIHKEAMSLYNTCSDLLKVCYTLYDPFVVLEDSVSLVAFAVHRDER